MFITHSYFKPNHLQKNKLILAGNESVRSAVCFNAHYSTVPLIDQEPLCLVSPGAFHSSACRPELYLSD